MVLELKNLQIGESVCIKNTYIKKEPHGLTTFHTIHCSHSFSSILGTCLLEESCKYEMYIFIIKFNIMTKKEKVWNAVYLLFYFFSLTGSVKNILLLNEVMILF